MANLQSKCGKEEFIAYLTEIFETPSSELPTSHFPSLILEKTGIEVEFNDLGALFLTVVKKDLRSRPRKLAVVKEVKPPRVKKPTVLNILFGEGEELEIDLKKTRVTDVDVETTETTDGELVVTKDSGITTFFNTLTLAEATPETLKTEAETETETEVKTGVIETLYGTLGYVINPVDTEAGVLDTDPLANNHLTSAFTEALIEANTTFEFVTVDYTSLESVNTNSND